MKRPLFDMIDRWAMIENNSFYASRLQLSIALSKLKREIDRIFSPLSIWLAKQLNN